MATINVKDASGATEAIEKPLSPGQATMANSRPVAIASDQTTLAIKVDQADYETVAASQTDQALGATGATGD